MVRPSSLPPLSSTLETDHHAFLVRFSGVPRVLDGTLPDHFKLPEMDGEVTWDPAFSTYLETTRCASLSISSSHRLLTARHLMRFLEGSTSTLDRSSRPASTRRRSLTPKLKIKTTHEHRQSPSSHNPLIGSSIFFLVLDRDVLDRPSDLSSTHLRGSNQFARRKVRTYVAGRRLASRPNAVRDLFVGRVAPLARSVERGSVAKSTRWRRAGWEEGRKDGQVVAGLLAYKVDCLVEDVAAGGGRGGLLLVGHDGLMEKESRVQNEA